VSVFLSYSLIPLSLLTNSPRSFVSLKVNTFHDKTFDRLCMYTECQTPLLSGLFYSQDIFTQSPVSLYRFFAQIVQFSYFATRRTHFAEEILRLSPDCLDKSLNSCHKSQYYANFSLRGICKSRCLSIHL